MSTPIQVLKPDHIVLNVQDLEASLHFYNEILGMKVERLEEYRAGKVSFPSVRMGEQLIDLFPPKVNKAAEHAPDNQQRLNHFCVCISAEVALAEVEEYLQKHQIAIETKMEHNWGAWGYGTSLYIRDPDNNVVELKQYDN